MKHKFAGIALAIVLVAASAFAQNTGLATAAVEGVVFTVDASGSRAVVPVSRVSLDGPTHIETESDSTGKFAFNAVPPGAYTINAQAPGLAANRTIEVTAGSASEIALKMKVQAVVESTTVTASTDPINTKESPGTSMIGESAIRNMPNLDERFQSLLPLIPGVVRGPNGLINMKGAQASQNGSLLNSADVTDPATGTSALNIPIDVVSSVHVLSTPYDPEYGKFTGAVSNIETRPGSFNKFRLSAQNLLPRLRRVDGSIMGIAAATPRVAVILAAGQGTRIRSVHGEHPKCLIQVDEATILDHQLEALSMAGINEVAIVVGYEKEQIVAHVRSKEPSYNQRVYFIENPAFAITNNIYSLRLATDWLRGDSFIVLNADVIFDPEILNSAVQSYAPISMIVDPLWRDETMKVIIEGDRLTRMSKRISQKSSAERI